MHHCGSEQLGVLLLVRGYTLQFDLQEERELVVKLKLKKFRHRDAVLH